VTKTVSKKEGQNIEEGDSSGKPIREKPIGYIRALRKETWDKLSAHVIKR